MLPRKTCAWAAPSRRREIKQNLCMDITPRLEFRATRRGYDGVTADKTVGKRLRRAGGRVQSNSQMAAIRRDYGVRGSSAFGTYCLRNERSRDVGERYAKLAKGNRLDGQHRTRNVEVEGTGRKKQARDVPVLFPRTLTDVFGCWEVL